MITGSSSFPPELLGRRGFSGSRMRNKYFQGQKEVSKCRRKRFQGQKVASKTAKKTAKRVSAAKMRIRNENIAPTTTTTTTTTTKLMDASRIVMSAVLSPCDVFFAGC